jgi:hypothetical protein
MYAMTKPKPTNNGAALPLAVIAERLCLESKFNRKAIERQRLLKNDHAKNAKRQRQRRHQ